MRMVDWWIHDFFGFFGWVLLKKVGEHWMALPRWQKWVMMGGGSQWVVSRRELDGRRA